MDYMEIALALSKLALGQVSPNPAVGAVIVKNNVILGQGYTQPPGYDHAEIVALKQAGRDARGAPRFMLLLNLGVISGGHLPVLKLLLIAESKRST
jgi:diaminohydroxyphosphoribosylaminopyrimidine deaminase/5-amino-6-(5-phosphoribosylamino)uracil reductase